MLNIVTRDSKGGKPIYRLYRAANYYIAAATRAPSSYERTSARNRPHVRAVVP
ncbi:MAG: hypothetical protein ACLRSW_00140 [Christensenellaceae bacterium]